MKGLVELCIHEEGEGERERERERGGGGSDREKERDLERVRLRLTGNCGGGGIVKFAAAVSMIFLALPMTSSSFIHGCSRASVVLIRILGSRVNSLLIMSFPSSDTPLQYLSGNEYLAWQI